MGNTCWRTAAVLGVCLLGCGQPAGPRLALPTAPTKLTSSGAAGQPAAGEGKPKAKYNGRTAMEWSQLLTDSDLDVVRQAAMALQVLRADGRAYLVQGLESSVPETRRMCLDSLSASDLRAYGDQGRQLLVKLAGDKHDLRIRERATGMLQEWSQVLPAP